METQNKKVIVVSYTETNLVAFVIENLEYPKTDIPQIENFCKEFFRNSFNNITVRFGDNQIAVIHDEDYFLLNWSWHTSFNKN